jgi:hypothetical protein
MFGRLGWQLAQPADERVVGILEPGENRGGAVCGHAILRRIFRLEP